MSNERFFLQTRSGSVSITLDEVRVNMPYVAANRMHALGTSAATYMTRIVAASRISSSLGHSGLAAAACETLAAIANLASPSAIALYSR